MNTAALDLDSTLIRRGVQATTISEMTQFVATMEQRPLPKLLEDLPGFARLSETKFNLARAVFRRRLRTLLPAERAELHKVSEEIAGRAHAHVAERIRGLFRE